VLVALSYSLLVIPLGPDMGHDAVTQLAPDLITWRGSLTQVIDGKHLQSWRSSLGDFGWSDLTAEQRFVMTWSDPWDEGLPQRVMVADHAAKLLKRISPFSGIVHRLRGAADSIEPVKLSGISIHEPLVEIPAPPYAAGTAAWNDYFPSYYKPEGHLEPDWFDEWCRWIAHLDTMRKATKPLILRNAVGSFERGLTHHDVDARIPELVRAAEAIIALPRGGGVGVFVRRAMHFLAGLASEPYLLAGGAPTLPSSHIAPGKQGQKFRAWYEDHATSNIERWLAVLYGHRSDCVHGKVPFEELRKISGGDFEAARFDWLAEHLAREVVGYALKRTDKWPEFEDRSTLEDAWRPEGYDEKDPNSPQPRLP